MDDQNQNSNQAGPTPPPVPQPPVVQPPMQPAPTSSVGDASNKKSRRPILLIVLILLVVAGGAAAYFYFTNSKDKQNGSDAQSSVNATEVEAKPSKLIFCSQDISKLYELDFKSSTDVPDKCLDDTYKTISIFSPTGKYFLTAVTSGSGTEVEFHDIATQAPMKVAYTTTKNATVVDLMWANDDSAFFIGVRMNDLLPGYTEAEVGAIGPDGEAYDYPPKEHIYYKVDVNDGQLTEPKQVFTENGGHYSPLQMAAYDSTRNWLITYTCGADSCDTVRYIDIATGKATEIPVDDNYPYFDPVIVDTKQSVMYVLDNTKGALIQQNYETNQAEVLYDGSQGALGTMQASGNKKHLFLTRELNKEESAGQFDKQRFEVLYYDVGAKKLDVFLPYNRIGEMYIETVSPTGDLVVIRQQDFTAKNWPNNYYGIVKATKEETTLVEDGFAATLGWIQQ